MGPLCRRKYKEATRPEIRAYFSFCPAITAAPRLHSGAATNMNVAARTEGEWSEKEGHSGKDERGGKATRRRERTPSEKEQAGGRGEGISRRGRNPISYSSGIPLDLPAFLLHLPPVRICFIYISYFSLSLFLFLCALCSVIRGQKRSTVVDSHGVTTKYEVEIRNPLRVYGERTACTNIPARHSFS